MASKVTKLTTGLTGLKVLPFPKENLTLIYTNLLSLLQEVPCTSAYRKYTEEHVEGRLEILKTEKTAEEIEKIFNSGQIEEVVVQAKREYYLARKMVQWKPWEGTVTQPPTGQWTWP